MEDNEVTHGRKEMKEDIGSCILEISKKIEEDKKAMEDLEVKQRKGEKSMTKKYWNEMEIRKTGKKKSRVMTWEVSYK